MDIEVELAGVPVGVLETRKAGGASFRFHDSYVDMLERPILGQAFEENLRRTWKAVSRLPEFFSNLLPEGALRELVAAQLGVGEQRETQILIRLAEDLPGAVVVRPLTKLDEGEPPPSPEPPSAKPDAPLRFSLAGVQTKFSVLREAEKFTFPASGVGGDWLVKLPDLEFAAVPENEYAMMRWAERSGIAVPEFALIDAATISGLPSALGRIRPGRCYAIERFDRSPTRRVHIEDFAQVFGIYPEAKYDHFNFESIAYIISQACSESSLREYVRRLVFMVVSGNADMHLKNWSLRYADGIQAELSPAYDLVSTVVYPDVKRELALRFSKSQSFDAVEVGHFERMFRRIGRDPAEAQRWVEEDLEGILAAWAELEHELPLDAGARAAIASHQQRLTLLARHRLRPGAH